MPLRMIAAGVADKVGLLLMVIAPTRVEAMNFPNGELTPDSFTYDFDAPGNPVTDFTRAFDALNRSSANRLWLTEASIPVDRSDLENGGTAATAYGFTGGSSRGGFGPGGPIFVPDRDALVDDVREAFSGIGATATLTRLRADLGAGSLDRDLNLAASEHGERTRFYTYGVVRNTPGPFPPCGDGSARGVFRCATSTTSTSGSRGAFAALLVGALTFAARRRRAS